MNSISQLNHEGEFERAWADPSNTRFELPSVDVNRVLAEHYRTSEPLTFTRTMLWDMEVRKTWRPDLYIPSLAQEGSAGTWSRCSVAGVEPSPFYGYRSSAFGLSLRSTG